MLIEYTNAVLFACGSTVEPIVFVCDCSALPAEQSHTKNTSTALPKAQHVNGVSPITGTPLLKDLFLSCGQVCYNEFVLSKRTEYAAYRHIVES